MKNIFILIAIMLAAAVGYSQTNKKTVTIKKDETYAKIIGSSTSDTLRYSDSISYTYFVNNDFTYKIYSSTVLSKITSNDTLVVVSLYGKNFAAESYTLLARTSSGNITSTAQNVSVTHATAVPYRYIRVVLRRKGKKTSTGSYVVSNEIKFVKQ